MRAQGYSADTIKAKLGILKAMEGSLGIRCCDLTVDDVALYLDRELAPWSRIKYLSHLRSFAAWAGIPDPTAGMRSPNKPRGVPRPLAEENLARMLGAAVPRTRAFIVLGAFAGLRCCEMARVRADDFEGTADGPALRVLGKGGRLDVVPVPRVVVAELQPWREASGGRALWPGLTSGAVQEAIRRCARTAGVDMTPHQLRHRYGTQLYARSRDLVLVQQLMRHASPNETVGYAMVANRLGSELVELLPL